MSAGRKLPGTPEPMHRWIGDGGLHIAGDTWGPTSAPSVVLLHGGGQTRHAWKQTGVRLASAGYRVAAFDARGHGDSDWAPDGAYDHRTMARDLRLVVEALGDPRPVLVGASLGGGTALVGIGEGIVDASALVLVDVAPLIENSGVDRIHEFMNRHPNGFDTLESVAEVIASYQPQRRRSRTLDGLAKNVRIGPDGRYRWHWDPVYQASHVGLDERRVWLSQCARQVRVPTLLLRGVLSDLLSEAGAADFLQLCTHAEYVSVTDAAHMVAGDRNDIFGDAVIEFLSRAVPVSA